MIRRPPRATRTDTRFPYTTLVRSYGEKLIERIETEEALERITSSPVRIAYILCVGEGHDEAAEHEKEINAEPAVAGIVRKDRGQVKARLRDHDRQVECQYCHGRHAAADLQRFDLHRRIMRHKIGSEEWWEGVGK